MALLVGASTLLFSGSSLAADPPKELAPFIEPVNERVAKTWEFIIAPYLVGANITGTSQVGRLPATNIDVGTSDILSNLRFGFMGRAEAVYQQRFGAMVDVAYMNLANSTDALLPGGRIRVGGDQLIVEGMLLYRAYSTQQSYFDLIAGARYWDINLDFNRTGTVAGNFYISRGADWIDPVIGVRGFHKLNEKWSVSGRGDIGGFGAASDFTWNVQAGVGYHFNEVWSTHLQYKALGVDYSNGKSGIDSFAYDTVTHGPLLGVVARF
ncbi:hypothetical protein [Roseibium alexandrii]|uniref:hypothetical protein n=1 Tax=Roseibium alexandrii TaxID=388408 RepID=UPI000194801F|nr:hypothetical protein [Roseibium alexandrii]